MCVFVQVLEKKAVKLYQVIYEDHKVQEKVVLTTLVLFIFTHLFISYFISLRK